MYDSLASDDFEPRNGFPLRSASETVPIPSVPEVSIISDQPLQLNLSNRPSEQNSYQSWYRKNYIPEKPTDIRPTQFSPDYNQFGFSPTNDPHQSDTRESNSPRPRFIRDQQEIEKQMNKSQNQHSHSSLRPQNQKSPQNLYDNSQSLRHQKQGSPGQRQGQDSCRVEDCDCCHPRNVEPRNVDHRNVDHRNVDARNVEDEIPRRPVTYRSPQHSQRNLQEYHANNQGHRSCEGTTFDSHPYQSESCRSMEQWRQNRFSTRDSCSCSETHHRSYNSGTKCCEESYKAGENSETVRNLLVLVHSLSEQMKCLQMQVDRLFKIHEETLEERRYCNCKANRCRVESGDCVEVTDSRQRGERQLRVREEQGIANRLATEKNQDENGTFLEQKVSIGVMTSFEFKVQNNQQVDKEAKELRDKAKRHAFQEGFEARKKQSLISRKPNGLENINEDIENHSRSSNFVNLTTDRQSPENYRAMDDSYKSHRNDYSRERSCNDRTKTIAEVDPRKTPQTCRLQNKNFETPERCPRRNNERNPVDETIIYQNDKTTMNNEDSSDEESNSPANHTPNVGWTFYNNVLGQVNRILKNSAKEGQENEVSTNRGKRVDFVKAATMEQIVKMGINCPDEDGITPKRNSNLEAMRYQKVQADMINAKNTNAAGETNTSMKMQALAMKYLDDNELARFGEYAIQKQQNKSWKQMMTNGDENNFSIATMKYLQKYQILPEFQQHFQENVELETDDIPRYEMNNDKRARPVNMEQRPALRGVPQSPAGTPNRILDFSALKNRPKLR